MSTQLYRNLFQYITKYAPQSDKSSYLLSTVNLSDHDPLTHHHANVWPQQNMQVAIHRTMEYNVNLHVNEEQGRPPVHEFKQMQPQADIELHTVELQMKKDLQI
jgi:hypothetical protein